jgi:hypothetical protein
MSNKSRLAIILLGVVIFSSVLVWMAFHPTGSASLWSNPLIVGAILVLCAAPIYPLYRQLSKRAPSSALAILLLIGALASGLMYGVADLVLHLEGPWVSRISALTTGLLLASCVMFIWNGFVNRVR